MVRRCKNVSCNALHNFNRSLIFNLGSVVSDLSDQVAVYILRVCLTAIISVLIVLLRQLQLVHLFRFLWLVDWYVDWVFSQTSLSQPSVSGPYTYVLVYVRVCTRVRARACVYVRL